MNDRIDTGSGSGYGKLEPPLSSDPAYLLSWIEGAQTAGDPQATRTALELLSVHGMQLAAHDAARTAVIIEGFTWDASVGPDELLTIANLLGEPAVIGPLNDLSPQLIEEWIDLIDDDDDDELHDAAEQIRKVITSTPGRIVSIVPNPQPGATIEVSWGQSRGGPVIAWPKVSENPVQVSGQMQASHFRVRVEFATIGKGEAPCALDPLLARGEAKSIMPAGDGSFEGVILTEPIARVLGRGDRKKLWDAIGGLKITLEAVSPQKVPIPLFSNRFDVPKDRLAGAGNEAHPNVLSWEEELVPWMNMSEE